MVEALTKGSGGVCITSARALYVTGGSCALCTIVFWATSNMYRPNTWFVKRKALIQSCFTSLKSQRHRNREPPGIIPVARRQPTRPSEANLTARVRRSGASNPSRQPVNPHSSFPHTTQLSPLLHPQLYSRAPLAPSAHVIFHLPTNQLSTSLQPQLLPRHTTTHPKKKNQTNQMEIMDSLVSRVKNSTFPLSPPHSPPTPSHAPTPNPHPYRGDVTSMTNNHTSLTPLSKNSKSSG
jgi:hypothetical protein